mmetsp:Transcript_13142/g.22519  ORF Transcript_13142/g.22519 Transcript_13142/m.22519 type:complete len:103 (+) Transcript_13142:490-798(+)
MQRRREDCSVLLEAERAPMLLSCLVMRHVCHMYHRVEEHRWIYWKGRYCLVLMLWMINMLDYNIDDDYDCNCRVCRINATRKFPFSELVNLINLMTAMAYAQ